MVEKRESGSRKPESSSLDAEFRDWQGLDLSDADRLKRQEETELFFAKARKADAEWADKARQYEIDVRLPRMRRLRKLFRISPPRVSPEQALVIADAALRSNVGPDYDVDDAGLIVESGLRRYHVSLAVAPGRFGGVHRVSVDIADGHVIDMEIDLR